ncbi:Importin N-terminal domain-containing protein [Aphelenchoides fujianensis]|nr:Importin N-terminal domain-containing protein [Aphelenchoides fujianensis]
MRSCPKCKSNEYNNRQLVMMINECGHPLCQNCVENIFARNSNKCPYEGCEKILRKNNFWEQTFDDPFIEKENYIRRKVLKTYNFLEDNFNSLKEYNDYLEHVEEIIFKLVNDVDVAEAEEEIRKFREQNAEQIERNRRRLNPDDLWIKEMLLEEQKAAQARAQVDFPTDAFEDLQAKPRSIISELRDSDLPAEMILDRERKVQLEAELAEKEERERKKRERSNRRPREVTNFGVLRQSGKAYVHTPVVCAWPLCDQILTDASSYPACLFAAQTIRRKMVRDFRELDAHSRLSLRESVVNHMVNIERKFPTSFQPIATQLCVALADLYLQTPEWNDFIAELLNKFASLTQADIHYAHILLELLKVFPEELTNKQLRIGDNRRNAVQTELAGQTPAVLACLEAMCQTDSAHLLPKAIQTFGSWMTNKTCPSEAVAKSHFYPSLLAALQSPACPTDVHFAAAQAVSNVLAFCENLQTCEELAAMSKDALILTAPAFEHAAAAEDLNKLTSYGRLYADLCQMVLEPLVNTPGEGLGDLRCLELLLRAADHHDYSITQHSFEIWYQLSESLYYLYENDFEKKQAIFRPFVERYILILYKHCRFDADTERMPSENDEFVEFRGQVSESIKDVSFIIGTLALVERVVDVMMASRKAWDEIEAGLFIIKSAVYSIVPEDSTVTPRLVEEVVLQIPANSNGIILTTTIELIGELFDWLAERPEHIVSCMNWLFCLPLTAELIKPWAASIQKLTSKGYAHLRDYFERIHSVLNLVQNCPGSHEELEEAAEDVLKAATSLLNDRPAHEISALLGGLLAQPLEYLDKACNGHPASGNHVNESDKENAQSWEQFASNPLVWLDRISCIYRMLKPWQEQASYREEAHRNPDATVPAAWYEHSVIVWKKLAVVFDRFKDETRVMEHCCRTTPLRDPLDGPPVDWSRSTPNARTRASSTLCGIIVDEYGAIPGLEDGLLHMLNVLVPHALNVIPDGEAAKQRPETVDDFFRLAVKFCYRMPTPFFAQEVAERMLQRAIPSVELEHQDANKSAVQFLTEPTAEKVKGLIVKYGEEFLWHCLHATIFVLSSHLRYDVARLIHSLLRVDAEGHGWLERCVSRLPRDCGLSATTEQLAEFIAKVKRSDRVNEISEALSELSRLYS